VYKKTVKIVLVISLSNFTTFDTFRQEDGQGDGIMTCKVHLFFTSADYVNTLPCETLMSHIVA